jgi:predicted amidophosphoribosyltransferase
MPRPKNLQMRAMTTEPINGTCPACDSDLAQDDKGFYCPNCGKTITDPKAQIEILGSSPYGMDR